jgi:hypothetical protein
MTVSVRTFPRRAILALGAVFAMAGVQGCLSYDETGVLDADGSGEVAIVFGVPKDKVDHDKIAEVKRAAKRLRGLRWTADIDSSGGGRRWIGAVIHFDSLAALRRLNAVLPTESMFETMKLSETDSGTILRRTIKIPSGSASEGDYTRISWKFPGAVLSTDRRAKRDSATGRIVWNLPVEGNSGEWAVTQVRWAKPLFPIPGSFREAVHALEQPIPLWALLPGIAAFVLSILTGIVVAGHLKPTLRLFVAKGRARL